MKIIKNILKSCASLVLCAGLVIGVSSYAYQYTNAEQRSQSIIGVKRDAVYNYIYHDNTDSYGNLEKIANYIDSQPEYIKEKFEKQNWRIILAKKVPSAMEVGTYNLSNNNSADEYSLCGGITVPRIKTIYVSTYTQYDYQVFDNFVHEFGHMLDYYYGYINMSKEFSNLYLLHGGNPVYNEYETSLQVEFFASSYMKYIQYPNDLKSNVPEVYDYMDNFVNEPPAYNSITQPIQDALGMARNIYMNLSSLIGQIK